MSRLLLSRKVRAEGSSRGPAGFAKAAKKENKQKKGGKNTRQPLKCILGTLWGEGMQRRNTRAISKPLSQRYIVMLLALAQIRDTKCLKLPVDAQKMFRQSVKSVFATRVHKWLIFNHIL